MANALFNAHRDDPEFDYWFLADEARDTGLVFADRTAVADLLGTTATYKKRVGSFPYCNWSRGLGGAG